MARPEGDTPAQKPAVQKGPGTPSVERPTPPPPTDRTPRWDEAMKKVRSSTRKASQASSR